MGGNTSKTVQDIIYEDTLAITNETVSTFVQKSDTKIIVDQEIDAKIQGFCGLGLELKNEARNDVQIVAKLSSEQREQMINDISRKVQEKLEAAIQQSANVSGIGTFNINDYTGVISNEFETNIKNKISSAVENVVAIQTDINQKASLNFKGFTFGKCVVTQEVVNKLISESVADSVLEALQQSSVIADVTASAGFTLKQSAGIDIGSIIGIIVAVVVFGAVFFIISKTSIKSKGPIYAILGVIVVIIIILIIVNVVTKKKK